MTCRKCGYKNETFQTFLKREVKNKEGVIELLCYPIISTLIQYILILDYIGRRKKVKIIKRAKKND